MPKVIDFGIAKATAVHLTDQTTSTGWGQFIGTPAYMSPEQAAMGAVDIDTRSDIYSFGVLLYELLTSKTPFDHAELLANGLDQMHRLLRERDPDRPSLKLDKLPGPELAQVARCRRIDPPKCRSMLCSNLDWIVMECLEKDRQRHYATAVVSDFGPTPVVAPEVALAMGSFEYRSGNFTNAVDWCQRGLACPDTNLQTRQPRTPYWPWLRTTSTGPVLHKQN